MFNSRRGFRRSVCGLFLGAVYLGLAAPALAWDQPLWVRQFGTASLDEASGIATDSAGDVYIIGDTGNFDSWIRKYNSNGKLLWKRDISFAEASGIAADAESNVYVTGQFVADNWLVKYNARGVLLWQQPHTGAAGAAYDIATDFAGNVYLAGGTLGFPNNAWVEKLDSAGNMLWEVQLGTEDAVTSASGVVTDLAGNVYLTGWTDGSLGMDAWVAKYDAAGRLLWKQQLGTAEEDFAFDVATDAAGDIYLAGQFGHKPWLAKFEASGRMLWQRRPALLGAATDIATDATHGIYVTGSVADDFLYSDAWIAKYDGAGRMQWSRLLGTDADDLSSGLATDQNGHVYITGTTAGSLIGRNRGEYDAWVAKYSTRR